MPSKSVLSDELEFEDAPEPWRSIADEFRELERSARFHAGVYYSTWKRWRGIRAVVGVLAALLAGLASATAFADYSQVAGALAAVAAAMAAVQSFLRPDERVRQTHVAAIGFEETERLARIRRRVDLKLLLDRWQDDDASSRQQRRSLEEQARTALECVRATYGEVASEASREAAGGRPTS